MDRRRAPFYLRRTKEAMVYFPERRPDGTWAAERIFTKRIPHTVDIQIDGAEFDLYREVTRGEFGLASGRRADGTYERLWFQELLGPDEAAFEANVFLLSKVMAEAQKSGVPEQPSPSPQPATEAGAGAEPSRPPVPEPPPGAQTRTLHLVGTIPPEVWNRLGTKVLTKLRSGSDLRVGIDFSVTVKADVAAGLASELQQVLQELGLAGAVRVE